MKSIRLVTYSEMQRAVKLAGHHCLTGDSDVICPFDASPNIVNVRGKNVGDFLGAPWCQISRSHFLFFQNSKSEEMRFMLTVKHLYK